MGAGEGGCQDGEQKQIGVLKFELQQRERSLALLEEKTLRYNAVDG